MPRIMLDDCSLTFHVRHHKKVTFKEFIVRGLYNQSRNPTIAVHALGGVSLKAQDGDRIGVIGHNGAGKSTLLKMLAGIYPPTSGTCIVEGSICSLFDITLGFEPEATGWDNIAYRSYLQGESPSTLKSKIDAIAEFSELGEFLNLPVRHYSAGMSMRLAFSIATATCPEVLLIDEVLAVGDLAFQGKAKQRMKELMASSRLMVLVAHDLGIVKEMCNHTLWMQHGRVVMAGPSAEVIDAYQASVTGNAQQAPHVGAVTHDEAPAKAAA